MRPVNLIPPEERRGEKAPLRTGALPYVIVAALALAVIAVALVVTTDNKIAEREAVEASLKSQVKQAEAEAERYQDFTAFASIQDARQETVKQLATSRFDWERALRELAIVIPSDVWLTDLEARASAQAATSGGSSAAGTEEILGPSLAINGCAVGHQPVARFLASLRDVDGVTRVSVLSSNRPAAKETGAESSSGGGEAGEGVACPTKPDTITTFEIVAAFDAATPLPAEAIPAPSAPTGKGAEAVNTSIPETGSTP